jgi:cytochrome P450
VRQYSGKEVDTLESDIDARVLELLALIKSYNSTPLDFAHIAQYFTLDTLSQIAFGDPFGYMAADADLYDYNKTMADFMPILEWIANHPSIRWLLTSAPVQALVAPKDTDAIGQGKVIGIAQRAVAARYGPDAKPRRDMLGHFVAKGLTQEQAEVESHLQIMAGAESTSSALRATFMLLLGSPGAYAKLNAEIEGAVEKGEVSFPVITATEAQKLGYLQAVIWEGLRLYPPLFGLQAKMAPPGGETVNGVFFPGGTEIAICDAAVGRKKAVFGADADVFRPERWTDADAATKEKYMKTVEIIFGAGRFVCLGKTIAMMEIGKALVEVSYIIIGDRFHTNISQLLRSFDWAIADPLRGVDSFAHGLTIMDNMNLVAWSKKR